MRQAVSITCADFVKYYPLYVLTYVLQYNRRVTDGVQ